MIKCKIEFDWIQNQKTFKQLWQLYDKNQVLDSIKELLLILTGVIMAPGCVKNAIFFLFLKMHIEIYTAKMTAIHFKIFLQQQKKLVNNIHQQKS